MKEIRKVVKLLPYEKFDGNVNEFKRIIDILS